MRLGDYEAYIRVDGRNLEEYDTNVSSDGKTATCWIPSEEGKRFTVFWRDGGLRRCATSGYVSCDGREMRIAKAIKSAQGDHSGQTDCAEMAGARTSLTTVHPFMFARLELTDNETEVSVANNAEHLGEVKLDLWRIQILGAHKPHDDEVDEVIQVGKVHEQSKKAGVHRVQFGQAHQIRQALSHSYRLLDTEPVCTFVFRYRPIDLLQANGIAPLPETSSEPAKGNIASAAVKSEDCAEPCYTQAQLREIEALESRLREIYSQAAPAIQTVKQEPISHQGAFKKGEVIDLTGLDD